MPPFNPIRYPLYSRRNSTLPRPTPFYDANKALMNTSALHSFARNSSGTPTTTASTKHDHAAKLNPSPSSNLSVSAVAISDESSFDASCSIQRVADVFRTGNENEVALIVREIPLLRRHCFSAFSHLVLPVLSDNLDTYPLALQLSIGKELLALPMSELSELHPGTTKALSTVSMRLIDNSRTLKPHKGVFLESVYGDLLYELIPKVHWDSKGFNTLLLFFDKCYASENPHQRVVAHKVLGGISLIKLRSQTFHTRVLTRLLHAVPDYDPFVAPAALISLSSAFSTTLNPVIHERLWLQILAIWGSSLEASALGKAEAVRAAAKIVRNRKSDATDLGSNELQFRNFYRSICRFAVQMASKDLLFVPETQCQILLAIASEFGILTLFSRRSFDSKYVRVSIDAFSTLSSCNDPAVRERCAFNFPGVSFVMSIKYKSTLTRVFEHLALDDELEVRETIAKGLHETIRFLINRRNTVQFFNIISALVRDRTLGVRQAALLNLSSIAHSIRQCKEDFNCDGLMDSPLLNTILESNWRTGDMIVREIGRAAKFFSAVSREEELLPLLTEVFRKGMPPVRRACGRAIISVLRTLPGLENRRNTAGEFYFSIRAEGCALRVALVETLYYAIDIFSLRSYRELFANHLLDMSTDPVSSVRMKIAAELHKLAPACQALPRYPKVKQALANDADAGVRAALVGFIQRASRCVQDAKEQEFEDQKKLEFEMFGSENEWDGSVVTKSLGIGSGISFQLNKLLPKRSQPLRRTLKGIVRAKVGEVISKTEYSPNAGSRVSSIGGDYSSLQADSRDCATQSGTGSGLNTSTNSKRFLALAEFYSEDARDDISSSLVSPDSTKESLSDTSKEQNETNELLCGRQRKGLRFSRSLGPGMPSEYFSSEQNRAFKRVSSLRLQDHVDSEAVDDHSGCQELSSNGPRKLAPTSSWLSPSMAHRRRLPGKYSRNHSLSTHSGTSQ